MKKIVFAVIAMLALGQYAKAQTVDSLDSVKEEKFASYYKLPSKSKPKISSSAYSFNYSEIAKTITEGCTSDYQKIKAIYQWICENISYDTSFKIRTADACYQARKGICQAYNELLYKIATAAGIKVEFVDGMSKDKTGYVEKKGHSWLFAYTSEDHGIFMDPTWGSGYVEGKTFFRRKNCFTWFNVDPEWLIFSHYPRDVSFQLLDRPMYQQEFMAMPPVSDLCMEYGLNAHDIYESIRKEGNTLPKLYSKGQGLIELIDIPLRKSLKVGESYTFRVKLLSNCDLALNNGSTSIRKQDWKDLGENTYFLKCQVQDGASLSISVKDESNEYWNIVVNYDIEP